MEPQTAGTVVVSKQGGRVTGLHMRVLDSFITAEELETLRERIATERPNSAVTIERVAAI